MPSLYDYPYPIKVVDSKDDEEKDSDISEVTLWYMMVLLLLLVIWFLVYFCLRIITLRQKTRSSQQRRTYMGSRQHPTDTQTEPTIYVSPNNLPPPPKYEAMAPPSYEEVVGIHYPNFQPISQPITTALAQNSNSTNTEACNVTVVNNVNNNVPTVNNSNMQVPSTIISIPAERSPVTASS